MLFSRMAETPFELNHEVPMMSNLILLVFTSVQHASTSFYDRRYPHATLCLGKFPAKD